MVTRLFWWCGDDDDDVMMRVAAAAETGGGGKRRVEESGCGDRIDPVMRSVFGVGRKIPPENFSGGGSGGRRQWEVVAGYFGEERGEWWLLPKDIYTLINHYTEAKDIWDNVKMLLEGSELTKEDRESQLYDDFEHFHQNKGETIHDYYVWFAKLINDMRNIKMTMSRMQLNSKFVNNMLPKWGRFVTTVKLNRGLRDFNYDQLYAYLKQHEAHTNENKMMLD
ncbi:hypothetical protein Tco_1494266 [Tanacetum coccineum]